MRNYIYTAAGVFILYFIVQIIQKRPKNLADYLLIAINICIGFFLLADVWVSTELTSFTVIFQNAVPLFLFPLFAVYVLQFVRSGKTISPWWYLIFLPGIGFVIYSIVDHFVLDNYQAEDITEHFNNPGLIYQFFFKGSQLLFIGILIWVLGQLKEFEQALKAGYSYIDIVSLEWLRNFTIIYLVSIVLTFVLFLLQNLGILPMEIKQVFGLVYGLLVLSVFYLNYHGIRHYTISQVYRPLENSNVSVSKEDIPLANPSEIQAQAGDAEIHQKLLALFRDEKVFLQPKYGLKDLSDDLGAPTHTVSRVINTLEKKSFYDLVNNHRVEYLKTLLEDPKKRQYTILALGLESGFNSKASINRIFKNNTGLTPKQYLDQVSQAIH